MTNTGNKLPEAPGRRRYTWPWFVLAAVLLAVALAVAWMSREVQRARRIHDINAPVPQTNRGGPDLPGQ
jgi:hypothetical protein